DLWGCNSVAAIEALYKELRKTWTGTWLEQAAEACAARKKDVLAAENDSKPQDRNKYLDAVGGM
ncbi:hypothetical protein, partial [Mesorhizobium sp. M1D.F.Ca.ET.234.01.1.1]